RSTIEAQRELGRFRQRFLQLRGDAVGRYDIEADAWAQNDARALRFFIDAMRELEDVDLAGNVEIVHVRCKAALHHRTRRERERSCAVEDCLYPLQRRDEGGVIIDGENEMRAVELRCETLDFLPRA